MTTPMRDDMYKVIVERPRLRYGRKPGWFREGRIFRNRVWGDEDGQHGPHHLGMRRGYKRRKWLNENLAPLYRWLDKQAGRPWDDVYGELARNIDRRNTVQAHIFTHIEDRVEIHTSLVRGEVYSQNWRGYAPIRESRARLFVHPVTRVLERNLAAERHERERKEREKREAEAKRKDVRVVGPLEQLRRIEGIWYQVSLAPLPADGSQVWDVVARGNVARKGRYGPNLYAHRKRQLNKRELRHHKLHLEAGNFPASFFGDLPHRQDDGSIPDFTFSAAHVHITSPRAFMTGR